MRTIIRMVVIRSVYPHFLFKRGSAMHLLFLFSLAALIGFCWIGFLFAIKIVFSIAGIQLPFSALFEYAAATFGVWALIAGIMYGLNHA